MIDPSNLPPDHGSLLDSADLSDVSDAVAKLFDALSMGGWIIVRILRRQAQRRRLVEQSGEPQPTPTEVTP